MTPAIFAFGNGAQEYPATSRDSRFPSPIRHASMGGKKKLRKKKKKRPSTYRVYVPRDLMSGDVPMYDVRDYLTTDKWDTGLLNRGAIASP